MTFAELKKHIDAADEAIRICESKKGNYSSNKNKVLQHLSNAISIVKVAKSTNKKLETDDTKTLKDKANALYKALEKSRKEQLRLVRAQSNMTEFIEDTLETNIGKATRNVFQYRKFRKKLHTDMVNTKLEIASSITQLSMYLQENDDASEKLKAKATVFLVELRATNFYSTEKSDKKRLVRAFKDLTEFYLFKKGTNKVRKGARKEYLSPLKDLLDKAIEYTENSGICWKHCHRLRDILDNNKYINKIRAELKVSEFEEDLKIQLGDLVRLEDKVKKMMIAFDPSGAELLLKKLEAVKIPKEIESLKSTYKLSTWAYENLGEDLGNKIGLPQTASFNFAIQTPDLSAEVDIPVFDSGFISIGFEFGASLSAGATFEGALTLHNFLSATEPKYVSGTLNAAANIDASAYVGISIKLIQLIKASGRMVLTGKAEIAANATVDLEKRDVNQLASFLAQADTGFACLLEGHLEAVVGLTAPVKFIIKKITGRDAEMKFQTPSIDFFEAKRNAALTFEMPFRKKPSSFAFNGLDINKGEWEINFIAKEKIVALWNEKYGGLDQWNEVQDQYPLSPEEIELLHEMYANFGQRETA